MVLGSKLEGNEGKFKKPEKINSYKSSKPVSDAERWLVQHEADIAEESAMVNEGNDWS